MRDGSRQNNVSKRKKAEYLDHNDHVFINYRGIDRRYLGIPDDPGRRIVTDFRYLCIAEIKKDRLEFMHKEIIFPFYGR